MKKRIIALLTFLIMLLALVTACDGNSSVTDSQAPSESSAAVTERPREKETADISETEEPSIYPLTDETVTLSYFTGFQSEITGVIDEMDNYASVQKAKEITNIHIDYHLTSGPTMVENMNIMFMSGDYTDFISSATDFYSGGGLQAIEDEVIIPLDDYTDLMPNYYSFLTEGDGAKLKEATESDGTISAVWKFLEDNDMNIGIMIRQDWLDALGLEKPRTYDEWSGVLQAIYTEYNCDATLFMDKEGQMGYGYMTGGYGIYGYRIGNHTTTHYYKNNGTIASSLDQDSYRDYLRMMAGWYADGYISSDFATAQSQPGSDDAVAALSSGNTAIVKYSINAIGAMDSWSTDDSLALSPLTQPVLKEGDTFDFKDPKYTDQANTSISTKCEHPELAVQWLDFWFSDEGIMLFNYGVEGEAYELDSNGNAVITELVTNNNWGVSSSQAMFAFSLTQTSTASIISYDRYRMFYNDLQTESIKVWNEIVTSDKYLEATDVLPEYSEEFSNLTVEVQTYASECLLLFITGGMSLDGDWDSYVTRLHTLGLERLVEIMQISYENYLSK